MVHKTGRRMSFSSEMKDHLSNSTWLEDITVQNIHRNITSEVMNFTSDLKRDDVQMKNWEGDLPWYFVLLLAIRLPLPFFGCGNLAVLWFILKTKRQRTPINQIVAAMSLANLFRGVVIPLGDFVELVGILSNRVIASENYCKAKLFTGGISYHFSLLISVVLAVMRAYICLRIVIVRLKDKHALTIILLVSAASVLLSIEAFMTDNISLEACMLNYDRITEFSLALYIRVAITMMLFICVFCSYLLIAFFVCLKHRNFKGNKKDMFSIKFGVTLSLVFASAYILPFGFVSFVDFDAKSQLYIISLFYFFISFNYTDAIVSPIIYFVQNSGFRAFVKSWCDCKRIHKNKIVPVSNSSDKIPKRAETAH